MIFNKNNSGQTEIKSLLGFISKDVRFDNLKPYIVVAQAEVSRFISKEVFTASEAYYNSNAFNPDGTAVIDQFVVRLQAVVILKAYILFVPSNDLSHSANGRTAYIEENAKLPAEWMVLRDEQNLSELYFSFLDYLLLFLDENKSDTTLAVWTTTGMYDDMKELLIQNSVQFTSFFDIQESRSLFISILPILRRIQFNKFLSFVGNDLMEKFIAFNKTGTGLTDDEKNIYNACLSPLALFTIADALKTLSSKLFSDRIVNTFLATTAKAERTTPFQDRMNMSKYLSETAENQLNYLSHLVSKYNAEKSGIPVPERTIPSIDPDAKIISI